MNKRFLLFDLDGTLTEPKIGITSCVQYALKHFGIDEPNLDNLVSYIGPPLIESFQKYHGLSVEQAETAVEKYRERFRDIGIFENDIMPGMDTAVRKLYESGKVLALATSKPQEFAERIMEHYGFSPYFVIEMGSGMKGERKYKADVINAVYDKMLAMCKEGSLTGLTKEESNRYKEMLEQGEEQAVLQELKADSVMIGDRHHDIDGAKQCGIESVGVRFGYAKEGELEEAGADEIVATTEELIALLLDN